MSRVLVVSGDGNTVIEIVTNEDGWTFGVCPRCGDAITDRGHFEDTVEACGVHVDQHRARPRSYFGGASFALSGCFFRARPLTVCPSMICFTRPRVMPVIAAI